MKNVWNDPQIREHFLEGGFGLEKESLRTDQKGNLAMTPHPFGEDSRYDRDFCENQVELVTGVHRTIDGLFEELTRMQRHLTQVLLTMPDGPELIWPFSNPPFVESEEKIPIARFTGEKKEKTAYREYLAGKYGKKKMLYCGIHFNYSLSDKLLQSLYHDCGGRETYRSFKDRLYLRLAKKTVEYDWLIVYLTAASPVMDGSFFIPGRKGESVILDYSSPRCSKIGYWNSFIPVLSYDSPKAYVDSIERYVKEGVLLQPAELYYPVRLKPAGVNTLDRLRANGVDHIELRMLDLNPLSPQGIMKEDLFFIHLMLLYMLFMEEDRFGEEDQLRAIENARNAALLKESAIRIDDRPVRQAAEDFLNGMEAFYCQVGLDREDVMRMIQIQQSKIQRPEGRYAEKICRQFSSDYVARGLLLACAYGTYLIKEYNDEEA